MAQIPYLENAIILAIIQGRNKDAEVLIDSMPQHERRGFRKQLEFAVLLLKEKDDG